MASRRAIRIAQAQNRLDEMAAMRTLHDEHKVDTRSSRQVHLGLFPELPWVGDVAETYGIALTPRMPDEFEHEVDVEEYLTGIGVVDETREPEDVDLPADGPL